MILTLATYPPSMMACTPTPSLSSLRQNYLASLQHRLTILQLRLRGDIMELEAGDSEPHMVTSPTSKLRPIFDLGNFCRWGSSGACCTVVLKGKGLWLQDSKSWPQFYMYIYFKPRQLLPTFEARDVYKAPTDLDVCTIAVTSASMFSPV